MRKPPNVQGQAYVVDLISLMLVVPHRNAGLEGFVGASSAGLCHAGRGEEAHWWARWNVLRDGFSAAPSSV